MKRQWTAVVVTLLMLTATSVWMAEVYHAKAIESQKRVAVGELSTLRAELDGQLTSSLVVLNAFQVELTLNSGLSADTFRQLAANLIDERLPIRHIAVAPDLVVQHVYPLASNEAVIGFDYRTNPEQMATVQRAISQQRVIVTGPVDLVQGGKALIARAPLTTASGENWGVIAEVLDIDKLLNSVGFYQHPEYQYALKSIDTRNQQQQMIGGVAELWQRASVTMAMNVPGYQWQLAAMPKSGVWASRDVGYFAIIGGGLMFAALVAAFLISILRNQRRLRDALAFIDHQARFDPVSQLPNRNAFIEHLQGLVAREAPFAILFIDLDHFKEVNDTLGHDVGDELIRAVADRLHDNLRASDFIARLGGDEFVVILYGQRNSDAIARLATDLNHVLSETFQLANNRVLISASIGIAIYPEDGITAETLLKHADLAMYAAKANGRRTYHFFNQELRRVTEHNKALKAQITEALNKRELSVHYQPIIDLDSGQIVKCEALVRWWHENRWIAPDEFIPIAERSGLIEAVGDYVFQQCCRDWLRFAKHDINVSMSINRSEQELHNINAAQQWVEQLNRLRIPTDKVIFEITESLLMSGKTRQLKVLDYLRQQGIRIALDDFGTGYSSISYLQKYAVDLIKIDRQFLLKAPDDQVQVALLTALMRVAQALNIKTVAEGLENLEQQRLLQRIQCNFGQGFYISEALPADQFIDFVKQWGGKPADKPGSVVDNHSSSD